ncbi:MAG TPA: glycogen debranching N-terminal domain-containing protein, partial [Beijerinckiaceae bacterium]|nr:glycogen debranching N-terminal domain-containing protein [Beijerinckiaceae bacterium]
MTSSNDATLPISKHPTDSSVPSDYDIEVKTSLISRALRNLKHGDAFAVLDSLGDVGTIEDTAEGLFYRDTRFLSHFELRLEGKRPLILRSDVHEDKAALSVDCTNPDLLIGQSDKLLSNTIFLQRTKFLWNATCYERVNIKNFASARVQLHIDFLFDADFRDLFEVRGTYRENRGVKTVRVPGPNKVVFHYEGLDKIGRETAVLFFPVPQSLDSNRASLEVTLNQNEQTSLFVSVACEENGISKKTDFLSAYRGIRRARRAATAGIATVKSSNDLFNEIVCRATSDVYTLITWGDLGPYPYAGIPWFSTIFGRDGIITAMFMIWLDASIARGVLRTLASTQATRFDPKSDAQPGKILHELRHGEMANLGEVPFARYYGSIDATPLFIMLAGMYFDRTGDRETILEIWPNIEAALQWIDQYGDRDGDGFVEYYCECEGGLANQGWKDSYNAIFHA